MIVDCFTHTWESPEELGRCVPAEPSHADSTQEAIVSEQAGSAYHTGAAELVDTTIVLGFKSQYLNAEISNQRIAAYVSEHPDQLIGFAGIDLSRPKEAVAELEEAQESLSMRGVSVAPAAQDVHPTDSRAMTFYAAVAERGMPIVFHSGIYWAAGSKLEYARPILLDEVARELPGLKIIIARAGYPWVQDTLLLLAKHPNVYAEISGLLRHPWQAYQSLLSANQNRVIDKLLFGSGFPGSTASRCIEELYSINQLCRGTNFPSIPRELLRGIVERDTLHLLGISKAIMPAHAGVEAAATGEEHDEF